MRCTIYNIAFFVFGYILSAFVLNTSYEQQIGRFSSFKSFSGNEYVCQEHVSEDSPWKDK